MLPRIVIAIILGLSPLPFSWVFVAPAIGDIYFRAGKMPSIITLQDYAAIDL